MKELVADFKTIFKKDKGLLVWMAANFGLAVWLGVGHTLLAARLYSKRGRDISRLFLGISVVILVIAICFLRNIIGEG